MHSDRIIDILSVDYNRLSDLFIEEMEKMLMELELESNNKLDEKVVTHFCMYKSRDYKWKKMTRSFQIPLSLLFYLYSDINHQQYVKRLSYPYIYELQESCYQSVDRWFPLTNICNFLTEFVP